jgi:hypothetical protein
VGRTAVDGGTLSYGLSVAPQETSRVALINEVSDCSEFPDPLESRRPPVGRLDDSPVLNLFGSPVESAPILPYVGLGASRVIGESRWLACLGDWLSSLDLRR